MSPRCLAVLSAAVASFAAAAPPPPSPPTPGSAARVLNIAHQGGEDQFPSNTLYAFKKAVRAGADMLELDIGVTKDGKVVVMHDTTVDRVTNGKGTIIAKTLKQIQKLDGAYWFSSSDGHYDHDKAKSAYKFRGIATGKRKAPKGFKRTRLPRGDAGRGHEGVPEDPDQHRDQGPHAGRGRGRVRRQRRRPRRAAEDHRAPRPDRRVLQAEGGRPLP